MSQNIGIANYEDGLKMDFRWTPNVLKIDSRPSGKGLFFSPFTISVPNIHKTFIFMN